MTRRESPRSSVLACALSAPVALVLASALLACSRSSEEPSPPPDPTTESATASAGASDATRTATTTPIATAPADDRDAISPENVYDQERYWPDIVALTTAYAPPADDAPELKRGYRGALMRVEQDGRVRIAFGRHGNHDVPLDRTDLVERANAIQRGERHKMGPNFTIHFGAQFLDAGSPAVAPFPTMILMEAERFLCVFADPQADGFPEAVGRLKGLETERGLRVVFFPVGRSAGETAAVRDVLVAAHWTVPFAYPGGADLHARALLGAVPSTPTALLVSAEGRVLARAELGGHDALERLRSAAAPPPDRLGEAPGARPDAPVE